MIVFTSRRIATVAVAFALLVLVPASIANAYQPVAGYDENGAMSCKSCGPNRQQTSGTATSGSAQQNSDGTSNVSMTYGQPGDGTTYSGTMSIVTTDDQGNLVVNITQGMTWDGSGGFVVSGWDHITAPVGGSISIQVNGTNSRGNSFSAGWTLQNYQP